jgi:hypothetical protein
MNTVTQAGPACCKEMKKKLSHVVKPLFILYNELYDKGRRCY